jgi:hypothetical protein
MPPSESEVLAIRLARMKSLIESLERVCSDSAEQRDLFLFELQEMEATCAALTIVPPPG